MQNLSLGRPWCALVLFDHHPTATVAFPPSRYCNTMLDISSMVSYSLTACSSTAPLFDRLRTAAPCTELRSFRIAASYASSTCRIIY